MRKPFLRKSIGLQVTLGFLIYPFLLVPAMQNYAKHPGLSWLCFIFVALLQATLGMVIENKFGEKQPTDKDRMTAR